MSCKTRFCSNSWSLWVQVRTLVLGTQMPFLLPDSVISKRERLEELLEWELIAKVLDVEGEKSV